MTLDMAVLFVFGTILGSFINALAFRHGTGLSMWGRSACTSCGKELGGRDLVPVLSYIFLGGKCRFCGSSISYHYPLIEVLAGLIAVGSYAASGGAPVPFILTLAFFMTLLFVALYDVRHTIIIDSFVYAAAAIALASHSITAEARFAAPPLSFVLSGVFLALPLFLIWLVSRGKAMGLGDSKLMLAIGFFLGPSMGAAALMLAFWMGALWGVLLLLLSRFGKLRARVKMNSELPFGPFLVSAAALCFFFSINLFSILSFFA